MAFRAKGKRAFVMLLEALEADSKTFSFPGLARRTADRVEWIPNVALASFEGVWADRSLFLPCPTSAQTPDNFL